MTTPCKCPRRRRRELDRLSPANRAHEPASAASRRGAGHRGSARHTTPPNPEASDSEDFFWPRPVVQNAAAARSALHTCWKTHLASTQEVSFLVGHRRVAHPIVAEVCPRRDEDAARRQRQLQVLLKRKLAVIAAAPHHVPAPLPPRKPHKSQKPTPEAPQYI